MLRPTSTSAMSMERISNAVPASSPLLSTVRLIRSGFSSTALCVSAEPTVVTMPSPTRATIVSSPAPPTSRSYTSVSSATRRTRALARSSMPSFAIAATTGVSMTFGLTLICTACKTSRPARSMAQASGKSSLMFAPRAVISAVITRSRLPPARKCASILLICIFRPAFSALISGPTIFAGGTRRIRMPISVKIETCTPEASAEIHRFSGINRRKTNTARMMATIKTTLSTTILFSPCLFLVYD